MEKPARKESRKPAYKVTLGATHAEKEMPPLPPKAAGPGDRRCGWDVPQ